MSDLDICTFKPEHEFFIGIDSDGTIFDSMEIKHRQVFQPVAVEVWGLQAVEQEFSDIAEFINLYSVHRGVNRFQGLAMAFERLAQRPEVSSRGVGLPDFSVLTAFAHSGCAPSAASLAEYNKTKQIPFLFQVLEWSKRSDERYAKVTREEGNPPFPLVRESLERASQKADLMIVSSSSREALLQDWGETSLLPLISLVAGQEAGSKAAQLKLALKGKHNPVRSLMIGDALGDLEAARLNNVMFYPILPGKEDQSWEQFSGEALERFFNGTYAGKYEQHLLAEFSKVLRTDETSALI